METIRAFLQDYLVRLSMPRLNITDILEIIIIAVLIYYIIRWVKNTRAWFLLRGLIVILAFWIIASIFSFNAIMWLFLRALNVGIVAIVILFQPEFRKALDQLGQKNIVTPLLSFGDTNKAERFSNHTLDELVRGTLELAKTKTGALMVIEAEVSLKDYESTGIEVDALVSSQLLVNIFEHNTPLHDGAVIIRGNRITWATCYLPLSDSMSLSKELGTRHRAALGISEVSDSVTIVVSEESGRISITRNSELFRNIDREYLRSKLMEVQKNASVSQKKRSVKDKKDKRDKKNENNKRSANKKHKP